MGKSAGLLAVSAALILNIAFMAPFSVARYYLDGGGEKQGTRAAHAFRAFVVSDALSFVFSAAATFSCTAAGFSIVDTQTRFGYLHFGDVCVYFATVSMVAAFALGAYLVVALVDLPVTLVVCAFAFLSLRMQVEPVYMMLRHGSAIRRRLGLRAWCRGMLLAPLRNSEAGSLLATSGLVSTACKP